MARYSLEGAYEAAQRLLSKNLEITAIFAMSDVMAIGAMRAIADKGLSIPEDISIIGFDGIDLATYYNPNSQRFVNFRMNWQKTVSIFFFAKSRKTINRYIRFYPTNFLKAIASKISAEAKRLIQSLKKFPSI